MWGYVFHAVTMAIASFSPDFEHFTWISIAAMGVYSALACRGMEHHYYWVIVPILVVVILGVTFMSQLRCDVFEEAYEENGALMFIVGNFIMHYAPLLIVMALTPCPKVVHTNTAQVWLAYALFMGWYYYDKPMQVYGCRLSESIDLTGVFLTCVGLNLLAVYY